MKDVLIRVTKAQPKLKKVMGSNQENQDSLSCFQENQEIESWSKKPNLAAKTRWISITSVNDPNSVGDGSQAQILKGEAQ